MASYIVFFTKYIIAITAAAFALTGLYSLRYKDPDDQKKVANVQCILLFLTQFSAYLTICLRAGQIEYLFLYAVLQIITFGILMLYPAMYPKTSRILVNSMCMLLSAGMFILTRLEFARAVRQLAIAAISLSVSMVIPYIIRQGKHLKSLHWLYCGLGIAAITLVFVMGQVTNGSKLSYTVGGITFQPSELVKVLYVLFIASMLAKNTSFFQVIFTGVLSGIHVIILVASKDLGSALIYFVIYVFMVTIASRKFWYLLAGTALGACAGYGAYKLFTHVQVRVQAWKDPWSVIDDQGYQITQSLFALGRGSWFGLGIGKGTPKDIPYVDTDFIFSAITEELGLIFSISILIILVTCFLIFLQLAVSLHTVFYRNIAAGYAVLLIFQTFLTVGGGTKFIPLTGVTLPLVSYGGSSVLSTIIIFAIVQGLFLIREEEEYKIEILRRKHAAVEYQTEEETETEEMDDEE